MRITSITLVTGKMILTLHRLSIPGQGELCDSSGLKLRSLILFSSLKKPFFLTRIDLSRLKLDQTTGKVWWKKKQRILDDTHKRSPVGSCHRTLVLLNMFLKKKKKCKCWRIRHRWSQISLHQSSDSRGITILHFSQRKSRFALFKKGNFKHS